MDNAKDKLVETAKAKAKLSEVDARTNLDKQSTARLMAGAMGAVSRMAGVQTMGQVLEEMMIVARAMQQAGPPEPGHDTSPLTSRECAMLLTGWVGTIGQVADIAELRVSVQWLSERDDVFWEMISKQVAQARALSSQAENSLIS